MRRGDLSLFDLVLQLWYFLRGYIASRVFAFYFCAPLASCFRVLIPLPCTYSLLALSAVVAAPTPTSSLHEPPTTGLRTPSKSSPHPTHSLAVPTAQNLPIQTPSRYCISHAAVSQHHRRREPLQQLAGPARVARHGRQRLLQLVLYGLGCSTCSTPADSQRFAVTACSWRPLTAPRHLARHIAF